MWASRVEIEKALWKHNTVEAHRWHVTMAPALQNAGRPREGIAKRGQECEELKVSFGFKTSGRWSQSLGAKTTTGFTQSTAWPTHNAPTREEDQKNAAGG